MDIHSVRQQLRMKSIYDIPLRVTYYARVSSESDEQLNSLGNQISYYEDFIRKNAAWTFVPGYIDEGLSGISTKRRENFNRMIDDAETGKFDLVITKEISRFARNTLDSIQYLASILVNRDGEEYCRLLLDSNGYREKRRKTLEQLADKIARSVLRSGRSTTLEPMNPYERRIIHSRISEIEGVTSHSVGEDPYRKVVVAAVGGKRSGGRGRSGGQHGRGGKRPYRTERKPEDFKRSDMDSMKTSFERDYKKPKPEDELNAGLYGKIEF